jgi:hypothetical protein
VRLDVSAERRVGSDCIAHLNFGSVLRQSTRRSNASVDADSNFRHRCCPVSFKSTYVILRPNQDRMQLGRTPIEQTGSGRHAQPLEIESRKMRVIE